MAKGGVVCQSTLAQSGAVKAIVASLASSSDHKVRESKETGENGVNSISLAHFHSPSFPLSQLTASSLEALAALARGHSATSRALRADVRLAHRLEAVMEAGARRGLVGGSADEGRSLMAAHVLVYVLGAAAASAAEAGGNRGGASVSSATSLASIAVPQSLYLSLEDAARLAKVKLPQPSRSSHSKDAASERAADGPIVGEDVVDEDPDASLMLLFEELAELQHTIHDVLLPRTREANVTAACR